MNSIYKLYQTYATVAPKKKHRQKKEFTIIFVM